MVVAYNEGACYCYIVSLVSFLEKPMPFALFILHIFIQDDILVVDNLLLIIPIPISHRSAIKCNILIRNFMRIFIDVEKRKNSHIYRVYYKILSYVIISSARPRGGTFSELRW